MTEANPQIDAERLTSSPQEPPPAAGHVYEALRDLLDQRGWARGSSSKRRLTLDAAIDDLLGTRVGDPATGAELARAARIQRHLRELSGAATLASWNDAAERRIDDVYDLLMLAGRAHPAD